MPRAKEIFSYDILGARALYSAALSYNINNTILNHLKHEVEPQ
jgi:hypothetical protein